MMDADIEGDKYGEGRGIQRRGPGPTNSRLRTKRAPNKEEKIEIFFWAKMYFVAQRICLLEATHHEFGSNRGFV